MTTQYEKGECLGYKPERQGFVYRYFCTNPECGRRFTTTSLEESVPVLCHDCVNRRIDAETVEQEAEYIEEQLWQRKLQRVKRQLKGGG